MKKRLLTMAALATAVTVGGVYATWTFSEEDITAATTTVNVAMTGLGSKTEKGTFTVQVMGEGGFTLSVDDSNNDHKPEIKKEGFVTVTFTPSPTASDDIKANGLNAQCVISYAPYAGGPDTLAEWTYPAGAGTTIFSITNDSTSPIPLTTATDNYNPSAGVFTWTIPASDIGIDLTTEMQAVSIDTLSKYNDLNAILAKGHFVLTVTEAE